MARVMELGKRPPRVRLAPQIICLAWLLGVPCVYGAGWELTPRIALAEIYTDNVGLVSEGEDSEFITQATPGFHATREGGRTRADIDYQLQTLYRGGGTESFHQLNANGTGEFYEDVFLVDADARVFQSVINPESTVALDNVNESDNRTDVLTANISPYWKSRFRRSVEARASYRYGIVRYDENNSDNLNSNVEDSDIQEVLLSLGNLQEASRRWTWKMAGDYTLVEYEDNKSDTFRSAVASLGYRVSTKLQFVADGGVDENDFESEGKADTSGQFWNIGGIWDLNSKNHLEAGFGRRYDGNVYNFLYRRKSRYAETELSYAQTLATDATVTSLEDVPTDSDVRNRFRSDRTVFERKLFKASSIINWSKSTINLTFRNERRDNQDSGNEDEIYSFRGAWIYRYGARTSMNLDFLALRQEFADTGQQDDLGRAKVTVNRLLGRRTSGNINYSYTRKDSDDKINEYRENRAWVGLFWAFR